MKTTIEIPEPLFRKVKSKAAERGQTLKEFMAEALHEMLASNAHDVRIGEPASSPIKGQNHQTRLTPYLRKTWSAETIGQFSSRACAASRRSNGSRWWKGSVAIRAT